jgi:hypothetical protein
VEQRVWEARPKEMATWVGEGEGKLDVMMRVAVVDEGGCGWWG